MPEWKAMRLREAAPGQTVSEPGDTRIVAAREALRKGDQRMLDQLAATTGPHVLDVYVRYWRLGGSLKLAKLLPLSSKSY